MKNELISLPTKKQYRENYRSIRSSLSDQRRYEASNSCFTFFFSSFTEDIKVLSYASKSEELNLWKLNDLLASRKQLLLPKVSEGSLEIYKVDSTETLIKSYCSIHEPDPALCEKANLKEIDIILVPGLCFDENFSRIGYGKGHYDRIIPVVRKMNPKVAIFGVGFKEQLSKSPFEMESHDAPLDNLFLF